MAEEGKVEANLLAKVGSDVVDGLLPGVAAPAVPLARQQLLLLVVMQWEELLFANRKRCVYACE